nr:FKBP-type peptidyl-prolyl cis-trans isomerase [uncultured Allomuricauda sp.]
MRYGFFLSLFFVVLLFSCKNDDDVDIESVPPLLLADVSPEDDEEIREFLETHFYNYEEFESLPAGFDFRIRIDTIAGENADKTSLWDRDELQSATIDVSSTEHGLTEEENDIPHTIYYLSARVGTGANPTVADSVFVRYEGKLLDGTSFDASLNNPVWFDLARLQDLQQGFRGFAEGIPNFKIGGSVIENGDGTVEVEGYGVGLIIFPSGLGNFSRINGIIPQYSPLMFTIDLFTLNRTDHDGDGIPSIDEDVNGNGFLYDDNTDGDDEPINVSFANFQDADDDGDGVSTRNEISDEDGNIILPYPSTGGIEDYLNPDVQRTPDNN